MSKMTSENSKKKILVLSVIVIIVLVVAIYYTFNARSSKNFLQLYDIKSEIVSGIVSSLEPGARDMDLDKNQANAILDEFKKFHYS